MKATKPIILKGIKFILLCTTCVMGYLLWSQINKPVTLPDIDNIDKKSIDKNELSISDIQLGTPPISDFDEMINRPLFFEDRQPFIYEEIVEKKLKQKKRYSRKSSEEYFLNAVVITPEKKIAIIQSSKAKEPQRIALGETINGWTLESIEAKEIKLSSGKETKTLVLEVKNSTPDKKQTASNIKNRISLGKEERKLSSISPSTDEIKIREIEKNVENDSKKSDVKDENLDENQESDEEN